MVGTGISNVPFRPFIGTIRNLHASRAPPRSHLGGRGATHDPAQPRPRSTRWTDLVGGDPRDSGEVQLAVLGKGDKTRNVLLPATVGRDLMALREGKGSSARVFPISERRVAYIVKAAARRAGIERKVSPHTFRHAHASHALDNGASIALVSSTLRHADLKTTSVYEHAKPGDGSSRFLK